MAAEAAIVEGIDEDDRAANADGEQCDGGERRAAIAHQRAPGEADVLPERVDPGQDPRVAKRFAGLRYAAELAPRGEPRLGVGETAATVLVGQQLEVGLQLLA